MLPVRHGEHRDRSGNPHGPSSDGCVKERHGTPVSTHKQCILDPARRSFTPVIRHGTLAVEVQHKCPATDATRLWLYQCQYHLHGDSGIDRAATSPKNFPTRQRRQRVGRSNCKGAGSPAGLCSHRGGAFRLLKGCAR